MRRLVVTIVAYLAFVVSAATAQDENLKLLIQQYPNLVQQNPSLLEFYGNNNQDTGETNERSGAPTASMPQIPSINNLEQGFATTSKPERLGNKENNAREKNKPSILQRYFSILSGELLPVYGSVEFSQRQDDELLFFNTVGPNYQLGPGDVVNITIRGLTALDSKLKITKAGNLVIENMLPLSVTGRTIAQTEDQIRSILKLDDASASAFLFLDTARLVTVQVSGNVESPRTIALPAYTPLSRLMAYIGGISGSGSLRNIVLRQQDGTIQTVDFYNFLQSPFGSNDPIVRNNSRVFIGNKGATVAASGYVARPGIYELPKGENSIPIKELLVLSGTSLIPPGSIVEKLSFDKMGIVTASAAKLDEEIHQGEALRIRFVETRDLANISIRGAVLDTFNFASNTSVPVQDILKNGAVLEKDALLSFAMIAGLEGQSRAINLTDAMEDESIKVAPGSTLHVFNQEYFNQLVTADPNKTTDPLVSKISETEIAEIYLNGKRIAFVPPSNNKSFYDVIRPFYSFTPQTILNFALVQATKSGDTIAYAVSLRDLLQREEVFEFNAGTKVFIFERAFYSKLLKRTAVKDSNLENSEEAEFNVVGEALNDASVAKIFLDGEAFALLPSHQPKTLSYILDLLGGLPVSISN